MAYKPFEKPFPPGANRKRARPSQTKYLPVKSPQTNGFDENPARGKFFERIRYTRCLVTLQAYFLLIRAGVSKY